MAQTNPNARDFDPEKQVMALLLERLAPFKVPQEILRSLRDDIIAVVTAPETRKSGRAAVMTGSASMMADRIRRGDKNDDGKSIPPEAGRPTQI